MLCVVCCSEMLWRVVDLDVANGMVTIVIVCGGGVGILGSCDNEKWRKKKKALRVFTVFEERWLLGSAWFIFFILEVRIHVFQLIVSCILLWCVGWV